MSKFSVIEVTDADWTSIISQCYHYDFYHTSSYHRSETAGKEEKSLLFVCNLGEDFIALPLIVRNIDGSDYKDCTSVYGYSGPLSNLAPENISELLIKKFQKDLADFLKKENIIAAFSRLHPLINYDILFDGFGKIKDINKTVAIDLRLTPDEQRKQFRKSNKSEINQLRKKKGYSVKVAQASKEIETFIEIYNENMRRVNAGDYYYFDLSYFKEILDNKDYEAKLLLAVQNEMITAGAIFTVSNKIMQYHLAGTKADYMNDTPMKLLLDEARLMGHSLGLEFLHLGGGVGGSDEDSLFRFKSGFSSYRCQFKTWQYILDKEAYNMLVSQRVKDTNSSFFPLYRSK